MQIPIELFFGFVASFFAFFVLGLVTKRPVFSIITGMLLLSLTLATTEVTFGSRIDEFTSIDDSLEVEERDYLYRVDTFSTSSVDLRQGTEARAQTFTVTASALGESFSCMELYVAKSGNPSVSQLVEFGVFDGSPILTVPFGTLNVTEIGTAFALYEFCLPDGTYHTISSGERIGARWNASADGNEILLRVDDTSNDVYDSTNSRRQTWTTTWANANGDMTMRLYNQTTTLIGNTNMYSYESETFEFTEFHKTIFAMFSAILMLVGAILWRSEQTGDYPFDY